MARLTNNQKKQIEALRMKGSGYKRTADTLGISLSTVKSYCRRHGLASGDVIVEEPRKEPAPHREPIMRSPKDEKTEPVCDVTLSFADESEFSLRDLACILTHSPVGR